MNYFEHQVRARRHTVLLLLLMGAAILSLVIVISGVLILILHVPEGQPLNQSDEELLHYVFLSVVAVVLLGSLYKNDELRAGGKWIAERLGGRLISLEPQNLEERQLLNVVEEIAIASGAAVPAVYVLDEASINAFAAGLTPEDAVIGVTRGALALLSREELQGVIAHEFSHIYNGDMRLNTRLTAVVHGLLLLGLIGELIMRAIPHRAVPNLSSSDSTASDSCVSDRAPTLIDKIMNAFRVIVVAGFALWVLGYAGTFFGNLIKSAVSRKREFLADASAVQFTRNPQSIAGALKKIGGLAQGSQLQAVHAREYSHLYFAAGAKTAMATHPPLDVRIKRIDPDWDGQFPVVEFPQDFVAPNTDFQPGSNSSVEAQAR
ncbi:M48 family metalloprotease [Pseudomonas sp. H9]|uniref:M48 family metalloprotease n=1 Tax=Pseudomonas sp. H9 TaxID=483968 RepID=UPI00105776A6|nr:M48 family metalloprotease [Pseudomonas sp. H9]TDF84073.1 peptidase M48 [Pseudomonas sp. H9]